MKLRIIYAIFALAGTAFLLLNNSSGAGATQGADRTGSPLSFATCNACHSGNNFSPSISLEVLDDGIPITGYEPGKTYQMRVSIAATGSPAAYGFQAVSLSGNDNLQAGTFANPPSGFAITTLQDRQYPEHSQRSSSNSFTIDWEAPDAGTGEVRFYASGIAANGDFNDSGDGAATLGSPVVLDEVLVSARDARELFDSFSVFPNPAESELRLRIQAPSPGAYQLRLSDLQGRILLERRLALAAGEQTQSIDIAALPAGLYALLITDGQRSSSRRVLKR